ncbi:alpha-N-arabinofuranosidase [Solimonas marina]|uniref:non-reducing end alpha-L-arabinofuranosidase n=1 Tax=Solimonas marina TaxID=2714601 RepID=A0A969WCU9_9GAMM|nr:alpha-N-arabinofuranosidase [Solimonas marina]NKF24208.1 alpha-N-arabinofuranosidase [Solimonas marina]
MALATITRVTRLAAVLAATVAGAAAAAPATVPMELHADEPGGHVSRNLFGQFAEHLGTGIYGGVWVGEDSKIPNVDGYRKDVVDALRKLDVPVVRWPGGCFADEYHWREGVGPRDRRPVRVNTHWGGVTESNAFGTHEFMNFAELIGAQAYVAGNVGDAPPEEMASWVEYMTSPTQSTLANERRANGRDQPWQLPYFGIGNELWGCGGNMRPEYAADLYRRYQTFVKSPATQHIDKIAPGANVDDYHWTDVMMKVAGKFMDGLSLHYYTIPGNFEHKKSATDFDENDWAETMQKAHYMDELITRHSAIMDKYDPDKKVALVVDEWGTWYLPTPGTNPGFLQQQNTLRDALVAAIHLNIFQHHTDRVRMANIAQMVNVLQAMIFTQGDRMVLTPTYHVFMMYKPFMDATHLPLDVESPIYRHGDWSVPQISSAAARGKDGQVYIALANLDPEHAAPVSIKLDGTAARRVSGRILTAKTMNAMNTFAEPDKLVPTAFDGAKIRSGRLSAELPAKSVVVLELH